MTTNCNTQNPLLRDGTSQQQRLLGALLPSYVSVDERSMEDLIKFASDFSRDVKYYDRNPNNSSGNWQAFMTDQITDSANQRTQPHYALFLAFLNIFKFAQDDLNTITKRHLDFYYREVLKLEEQTSVPDQVYLIFNLAKGAASALVKKDSAINAGKDDTGVTLVYKTSKDFVVGKAQVKELKSVFYNKKGDKHVFASPVANSADGRGASITRPDHSWNTFGAVADPALPFVEGNADRTPAALGLALSSPVLYLNEGDRYITITAELDSNIGLNNANLNGAFSLWFSSKDKWIKPNSAPSVSIEGNNLTFYVAVTSEQPAITAFGSEKPVDKIKTTWPVVKILLNSKNSAGTFIYETLKGRSVKKASINVNVYGVKNLLVQNDNARIDASKPFQPFGGRPENGDSFYIGSSEIFSKQVSSVTLNIKWKGLPEGTGGFPSYYANYTNASGKSRETKNFRAAVAILRGRQWNTVIQASEDAARLFNDASALDAERATGGGSSAGGNEDAEFVTDNTISSSRSIQINKESLGELTYQKVLATEELKEYDANSENGFIRLQLDGADFGHKDFQLSFAKQSMKIAASKVSESRATQTATIESESVTTKVTDKNGLESLPPGAVETLPNTPYTPMIQELSVNYAASAMLNFSGVLANTSEKFSERTEQYFHIDAFGYAERHPYLLKTTTHVTLIPNYIDEGSLMIGLQQLSPPQTLSVLFKVAEGTSDPDLLRQKLKWSYLSENEWFDFPALNIISDTTNNLLSSGIVLLDIPKAAGSDNTILSSGLHWIKVAIENDSAAANNLIDVRTQAVTAVFNDNGNSVNHLRNSLPPETVKGLVESIGAISSVNQPYASFGGKMKEQDEHFYARVSERLRHKNRAVNIWDYERLVLDKFPEIYKTKCVNHSRIIAGVSQSLVSPGHVSMLVISNVRNKNAVNPLQPKTSLLIQDAIAGYLKGISSPGINIHVSNPVYEEIQLEFNVRFMPGFDLGFYAAQLQQDIKVFLAPWAYNSADVSFGGVFHRSVILNFIEELEYVDYVTVFVMNQIANGNNIRDVESAIATTPASILTSAQTHIITVLEEDLDVPYEKNIVGRAFATVSDSCDCENQQSTAPSRGIGYGTVGVNFTVGGSVPVNDPGLGTMEIEDNFNIN